MYYNHREYIKFIVDKYNKSKDKYTTIFKENNINKFLTMYESMNVYPIYPLPIIAPLKRSGENMSSELKLTKGKYDTQVISTMDEINKTSKKLYNKIDELKSYNTKFQELRNKEKIRRVFNYEIRDTINKLMNTDDITNAWLKMYEILTVYHFFDNINNDTINTFHICEHPGKFIFAIEKYIKNNHNKTKHNYYFQSLKPIKGTKIFRADPKLLKCCSDKLDYGKDGSGDITNKDNIKYYREKYGHMHFNLITSDCGLNYSHDFKKQESGLYKIFFSAFVCAIGLSSQGSNYVFKLFSFDLPKTIELLQITCLFYDSVDLVRPLTTKSGSGEIYCVCTNFNYDGDIDYAFNELLNYIDSDNDEHILNDFNQKFLSRLKKHHQLFTLRRMTNINSLIFRFINYEYANDHPEVKSYVKNLVDYYTNYFIIFIGLSGLDTRKEINIEPLQIKIK